jgi:hypothetical protein
MTVALKISVMAAFLLAGFLNAPGSSITPLVDVSLTPDITIQGGSPEQHKRLEEAVDRFKAASLLLPDLQVEIHDDPVHCNDHHGLFRSHSQPWRILICSSADFVYEHELAHAWELANLTDDIRRDLMKHGNYSTWADKTMPWNERGVEGAALVIQQGLAGLPLPPSLSLNHKNRIEAFELLTGRPAPRLLEWCATQTTQADLCPRSI